MTNNLSANIITYNGLGSYIKETIAALDNYVDEILVYDTGSTDGTYDYLKSLGTVKVFYEDIQGLGKQWTDSPLDSRLTELLNILKTKATSEWIIRVDDDEIWTHQLLREIVTMKKTEPIYSVPFHHVGTSSKSFLVKRLFRNAPEVWWSGMHGKMETITYKGHRISAKKCQSTKNFFYHLGSFKKNISDRYHDYSSWL